MRHSLLFSLFIAFSAGDIHASSPNIEAAGMGCSGLTLDGIWSINQNPAGLQNEHGLSISASQLNRFMIGNWNDAGVGLSCPIRPTLTIGGALSQDGFSGFRNTTASIGMGMKTSDNWKVGASGSWVNQKIQSKETMVRNRFSTTIGSTVTIGTKTRLGIGITDAHAVFTNNKIKSGGPELKSGITFQPSIVFESTIECVVTPLSFGMNVGMDYRPTPAASLRIGYDSLNRQLSGGIGYRWKKWKIDSAIQHHPFLGNSTSLSVTYVHGKE